MNGESPGGWKRRSGKLEVKVIDKVEELESFRHAWSSILKENNNDNPFIELDWIEKWWKFLGEGHSMLVVSVFENGGPIGFCPLMVTKKRIGREINFIGYPEASYMDFILTEQNRERCIKLVMDYIFELKGNYMLGLHGFFKDSPNLCILKDYLNGNKVDFYIRRTESPYIEINRKFDEYYKERARHGSVKMMKNREKRLMEAGSLTYEELDPDRVDEIFKLHDKRWKNKRDTSNFSRKGCYEFFRDLALDKSLSFDTSVTVLKLGEKVIAFNYSFICNGKYLGYRIAFDDDFSAFAPGKIIVKDVIKKCFEYGIRIFDFGLGDAAYKHDWADNKLVINKIIFPSCNGVSRIAYRRFILKERFFNFLKKSKVITDFKTKVYDKIKKIIPGEKPMEFSEMHNSSAVKRGLRGKTADILKRVFGYIYSIKGYTIYEKNLEMGLSDKTLGGYSNFILNPDEATVSGRRTEDEPMECIICELNLNDLDVLCKIMNEEPINIVNRFYRKQRCFTASCGNKIIHCSWVDTKSIEISEIKYMQDMERRRACICNYVTEENYRNMGCEEQVLAHIDNILCRDGFIRSYIFVNDKNTELKNYVLKAGFKPQSYISYRKLIMIPTINKLEL